MALDENDIETRTLALERKLNRLYAVIDDMVIFRLPRLEQQLTMLWSLPPRRVAQVTGQVNGCASQGFPNVPILITNADGERLGTGKADSTGHFVGLANLESDPQTVNVRATPVGTYAVRFAGPVTESHTLTVGGNTIPTIVIPPAEDWCCGAVDYFPGVCPPTACASSICVQITSGCGGSPITGATVALKKGATTVATTTTFAQVFQLTLTGLGSGYTPGTGYALGFTGGGASTPATGTFDVSALGRVTNLVLTSGGIGYTSNPTVTFPGAGPGTGASATASVGSYACFHAVPYDTGYTLRATATNFIPRTSTSFSVPPCSNRSAISLPPATNTLRVTNIGACGGPGGVEIEAVQNGVTQTGTADSSGNYTFPSPFLIYDATEQPYPITLNFTHPSSRFEDRTYTFNLTGCSSPITLNVSSLPGGVSPIFASSICSTTTVLQGDVLDDYFCPPTTWGSSCYPVSKALSCNDPVFGAATLSFTGCKFDGVNYSPHWEGEQTVMVGSTCTLNAFCSPGFEILSCPGTSVTIRYKLNGRGLEVSYDIHGERCVSTGNFAIQCPGTGDVWLAPTHAPFSNPVTVAACPPALLLTLAYDFTSVSNNCLNIYQGTSGTFSITEA